MHKNVSDFNVHITTPEGEDWLFNTNSTNQLKDLIISLANNTDLRSSASAGDIPIVINNTIHSMIDELSSEAETIKSNSSNEGILPRSISVCANIPFVGRVCL